MKTHVIGILFFCFLSVQAMDELVSTAEPANVNLLELIGRPESPRWSAGDLVFVPIRDVYDPGTVRTAQQMLVAPRAVRPITAGSAVSTGAVSERDHVQQTSYVPRVSMPNWNDGISGARASGAPIASQSVHYGTFPVIHKRSCCERCRSWSGRAVTNFPFGCCLCFCCCMDEEGRPILVKKCLGDCEPEEYQVCAYLTCGGATLMTIAILASAGVLG